MTVRHDTPSQVVAEAGEVEVDGPDGIAYAMTPEAATITARRLLAAAKQADAERGPPA